MSKRETIAFNCTLSILLGLFWGTIARLLGATYQANIVIFVVVAVCMFLLLAIVQSIPDEYINGRKE